MIKLFVEFALALGTNMKIGGVEVIKVAATSRSSVVEGNLSGVLRRPMMMMTQMLKRQRVAKSLRFHPKRYSRGHARPS